MDTLREDDDVKEIHTEKKKHSKKKEKKHKKKEEDSPEYLAEKERRKQERREKRKKEEETETPESLAEKEQRRKERKEKRKKKKEQEALEEDNEAKPQNIPDQSGVEMEPPGNSPEQVEKSEELQSKIPITENDITKLFTTENDDKLSEESMKNIDLQERLARKRALREKLKQKETEESSEVGKVTEADVNFVDNSGKASPADAVATFAPSNNVVTASEVPSYSEDTQSQDPAVNSSEIEERLAKKSALRERLRNKQQENDEPMAERPSSVENETSKLPASLQDRLANKRALKQQHENENDEPMAEQPSSVESETSKLPASLQERLAKKRALKQQLENEMEPGDAPSFGQQGDTDQPVKQSYDVRMAKKNALKERMKAEMENKKNVEKGEKAGQEPDQESHRSPKDLWVRLAKLRSKKKETLNQTPEGITDPEPVAMVTKHEPRQHFQPDVYVEIAPEEHDIQRHDSDLSLLAEDDDDLPWSMYKEMKDQEDEVEEDEMEESESDDEKYVPDKNNDLPNLYDALDSLETEDIQLNSDAPPQSLFESDEQKAHMKEVEDLKQGLREEEIKVYLDEFEKKMEEEILMIGNISLEDVQSEELRLREEHVLFQQQQSKVQRQRQQEILQAMERAKKYVMGKYKEKCRELRMREEHLMQKDRSYKDEIHRAFRRSESQLRKALKRRKAEVKKMFIDLGLDCSENDIKGLEDYKLPSPDESTEFKVDESSSNEEEELNKEPICNKTMYGDLTFADGQYGGSKGRRWKIDWDRAPQPIQIKLKCLRGVKDKLPSSRYVVMVSLYSRLGGHVMKWSNLKGQQWGGATLPMDHAGEFFNTEIKIDQSVFTVCPSCPDIRPGMLLVFELFILRGTVTPTDKVVAWGCFPVCNANFNVVEGRYKTPLLRGAMDPGIDRFEVIEKLMADDLENWFCNMYFEIKKLPRYMAGQKEYEVELQFTSGLLNAPSRTFEDENIDGEKPVFGSSLDVHSSRRSSLPSIVEDKNLSEKPKVFVDQDGATSSRKSTPEQLFRAEHLSQELRKTSKLSIEPSTTSVIASRMIQEGRNDDSDSDGEVKHDAEKNEGFKAVKGQPGMFYKVHHSTASDLYARKMYTLVPRTRVLSHRLQKKRKLTHLEELANHTYSVQLPFSSKGHIDHRGRRKMQYLTRMLLSEIGISEIKSTEFWSMLFMLMLTYWMRMFCHYIGQWVLLIGFSVPINRFEFLPYTVNLNYQSTLLRTREEIALIVIGPFTNILIFVVMVLISAFIQLLFDRFPDLLSRFFMAFGIQAVLDPLWILLTDSVIERFRNLGGDHPIGDAFKLYWHFDRFYNNDNVTLFVSIALTSFLYFVTVFCALCLLYAYFLRVHNNGRLMDVYWRLHSKEEEFFLPYDLEVSNEELNYICRKAEQWRGDEGERRKTAVYDYTWEDVSSAKEVTTHVSIHTLHLDGLRELYRHFLKLPDGAIIEVFGEINIPGVDDTVKQELLKRTTFQTMDGPRKRRSSRVSSASSCSPKKSQFLDVPAV